MSQNTDNTNCTLICWGIGVVAGLLIAILMVVIGEWDWTPSLFIGVIAGGLLGFLLATFVCREGTAKADLEAVRKGEKGLGAAQAAAAAGGAGPAAAAATAAASTTAADGSADAGSADAAAGSASASAADSASTSSADAAVKPSKPLAGEAELAERKGDWKYEGDADAKEGSGSSETAAKTADAKGADDAAPVESAPETLTQPRGAADDLKKISGVGPKLEGVLNDLGFWHFWQIAQWGPEEVAWVDTRLKFKGRIERDDWISQAKTLSEGQGS